ncbi:type IV secretory system conjugative DNA transfer family protein [Undibacterium sp. Di26W]|uniref:type IV secretory system conjugative DNA transfer family protein n=1 Tax=Undibacterium sp. Di26W TaxID=3413035 RepID=UPI003BF360A2
MTAFAKDYMHDVPRGDTIRPLRMQRIPQACWMPLEDIQKSEFLKYHPRNPGKKILIGALGDQLIGIEDDRHLATIANSRSGKSVGLVSNLFFYQGSILATDPKGELALLTARAREKLGQKIHVLDPFKVTGDATNQWQACYNPMDVLDADSLTFLEDAALIAESIVVQTPGTKDPHWDESAEHFIEGLIIHVATAPQYLGMRNLVTVRRLVRRALNKPKGASPETHPALFKELEDNADDLMQNDDLTVIGEALFAAATSFYNKTDSELAGVYSTIGRHTKFLDYPAFRNTLQRSDFSLRDLKAKPEGVSVYLCFPATRVAISKRWMRLFINQLLDAMASEKTKPQAPVLVCLDEFPALGYMQQLEMAAGLIASFDVKLWIVLQDWSQGRALYGERWETFIGNAGTVQCFSVTDLATTRYISERLGKTPVEVTRVGEVGQKQRGDGLAGYSESIELHPLLTPDEVSRMFARDDRLMRQLVLYAGHHPMMLQRVLYYDRNGPLTPYMR